MSKPSTEEVLDDLDLLLAEALPGPVEAHHITMERLRARSRIGKDKARRLIQEWLAAGKIRSVGKRTAPNGKVIEAWERVKK